MRQNCRLCDKLSVRPIIYDVLLPSAFHFTESVRQTFCCHKCALCDVIKGKKTPTVQMYKFHHVDGIFSFCYGDATNTGLNMLDVSQRICVVFLQQCCKQWANVRLFPEDLQRNLDS